MCNLLNVSNKSSRGKLNIRQFIFELMAHFILEEVRLKCKPVHREAYVYNAIPHTSTDQQALTTIYIILKYHKSIYLWTSSSITAWVNCNRHTHHLMYTRSVEIVTQYWAHQMCEVHTKEMPLGSRRTYLH